MDFFHGVFRHWALLCVCGKVKKLQTHEINPLGDLPASSTWVYGLFSFVMDHNLDLELFASLVGSGVNLLPLGASIHLCVMLRAWQGEDAPGAPCSWKLRLGI